MKTQLHRICLQCGKEIVNNRKGHKIKYCNSACRKAHGWNRTNNNMKPLSFYKWPVERQERWLKVWSDEIGIDRLFRLLRGHVPTEKMVQLRNAGLKINEIAEAMNLSYRTIQMRLMRHRRSVAA